MKNTTNRFIYLLFITIFVFSLFTGIKFYERKTQTANVNNYNVAEQEFIESQELYVNSQACFNDSKTISKGIINANEVNLHTNALPFNNVIDDLSFQSNESGVESVETSLFSKFFNKNNQHCTTKDKKYVYLGGFPLGITLNSDQLLISSKIHVNTEKGLVSPTENLDIRSGDVLEKINGQLVASLNDVSAIIDNVVGDEISITIKRNDTTYEYPVTLAIDSTTKTKKLGLMLQDKIAGIGTMTYIDTESNRYGALGHPISFSNKNNVVGEIFNANINGAKKGTKGQAGELIGDFDSSKKSIGTIDLNNDFGIFGNYVGTKSDLQRIELGGAEDIKPGKAQIYTTIKGDKPHLYNIEIIKASYQSSAKTKSMVIRITDPKLLELSGGIVQGMSGSPIVQDGKLIGAVTHVFLNDSTKGYGLYAQWMIGN